MATDRLKPGGHEGPRSGLEFIKMPEVASSSLVGPAIFSRVDRLWSALFFIRFDPIPPVLHSNTLFNLTEKLIRRFCRWNFCQ